ncbi:unnamed protein product [Prorocentrum cordatum]|uniref:KHDC4/BBP-like KH-domain type I domain-containing protein n=1 Tax=Prorocentrum cordatum TaxID=2364126 RepID=A0ABN9WZ37_9DINO|nr:unnamed protein product [Polarella glacialis]
MRHTAPAARVIHRGLLWRRAQDPSRFVAQLATPLAATPPWHRLAIGHRGCNMRRISVATGAKLRIRGRGSGFLEGKDQQEAPVPLMVAVTADREDAADFVRAVEMTLQYLHSLEEPFHSFCRRHGFRHRGPFVSLDGEARELLAEALTEAPWAGKYFQGQAQLQA